ncbi:TrkH family potassium uptake protein [Ruania suaedae]|uniref:TrkH family potassium uptake protein n=1 Tax=Ruania suaedae TaxID=2897774 RepID=UPI001E637C04|nr:potassium transporter TrkG [Ruania suaedae]UFU02947.1 TrkH family potassium uptake protein [Ruania suaedae]
MALSGRARPRSARRRSAGPQHPAKVLALAFVAAIAVGTLLLRLPIAVTASAGAPPTWEEALFTATSAVCVTGLIVVDTATYWSGFGQAVIAVLIQIGGLGIMTAASLIAIVMARRLGLRSRLVASASVRAVGIGDVRSIVVGVAKVSFAVEALVAAILVTRYVVSYQVPLPQALWKGVFTAVSAFNNAGFALDSDSLMGYSRDPWVLVPVCVAVIIGGLGFPVLFELRKHIRWPRWSMHTKLVVLGTVSLLLLGWITLTALEWSNPGTLGEYTVAEKLLLGFVASVMTRTAGFNAIDTAAMSTQSLFTQDLLMFIGGGPAGTAGGVKVTTFLVLFFLIVTELRGETAVNIFGRRLSRAVHREAITVALLAVALVAGGTWVLLIVTPFSLDQVLFEVISAFATVGLSTGITADLPPGAHLLLVVIMFVGRLGPITVGSALALRERKLMFELPKERPIIG